MKIVITMSWVLCSFLIFTLTNSCQKSGQDEPEQEEEQEEENTFIDNRDGKQYGSTTNLMGKALICHERTK